MIVAELVDGCNLKCALCPNRFRKMSGEQMSLSTVKKILNKYKGVWIDWFNWGEPTLHKEFTEVANLVNHTPSRVSTNLSKHLTDEEFSALDKFRVVLVSLSGMTKEVYNLYHGGGNFSLVMANLDRLVRTRKKPIVMNWLSHKYNAHQYNSCKTCCEKWGVKFNPTPLVCTTEEAIAGYTHELLQSPLLKHTGRRGCRILLWDTIGADGSYLLCCATQNIKIGYTIDDDITHEEMLKAKMSIPVCVTCREKELWRMHS